jgi:hypothetical protein
MEHPAGARDAIIAERNRPPTPAEREHFRDIAIPLLRHDPELEEPVRDAVSDAMQREVARAAPEDHNREPSPEQRIDQRLADLQRITGSGVAPPHSITPPTSGPDSAHGSSGRSPTGRSLDR